MYFLVIHKNVLTFSTTSPHLPISLTLSMSASSSIPDSKLPSATKLCRICESKLSAYRCPNCRIQYCSVACFRKHKDIGCQRVEPVSTTAQAVTTPKKPDPEGEDLPYIVSIEQYAKLDGSENLRKALKDSRLQALLKDIDKSENPLKTVREAIEAYPEFAEFANEILQTIGVRDEDGRCIL